MKKLFQIYSPVIPHPAKKVSQVAVMVASLSVLILWAPKSILVTSILHTSCILLLNPLQTLEAILVLVLNKRLKDIACAMEF